jgi:hypothetical protein
MSLSFKPTRSIPLLFGLLTLAACGASDKNDGRDPDTGERSQPEGAFPGECDDGADNDFDGDYDCNDADCGGSPDCIENFADGDCSDGADNDRDGLFDCDDPDCADDAACATEDDCTDGADNDLDGLFDCADPDCAEDAACIEYEGDDAGECADGIDNDSDGLVDCDDPDCEGSPDCDGTIDECWSLSFDGIDDHINIPAHSDFSFSGDFTIEAYYQLATVNFSGWYHRLMGQSDGGGTQPKWIIDYASPDSGANHYVVFCVTDQCLFWAQSPQEAQKWTHLAVVRNGNDVSLFIDGTLLSTETYSGYIGGSSQPLTLGYAEGPEYFEGLMSSVRISDIARYSSDFVPEHVYTNDSNTRALWQFHTNTESVVVDETANGHDGTIEGATWVEDCPQ